MKRTIGLMLAGAALLGVGFLPLPIGRPFAAKSFREQLAAPTGLIASTDPADVRLTFLPFPKVRFANVRIADADGLAMARIGTLQAYLRPLDIVGGRLRFNGLSIGDAVIEAATPEARAAWKQVGSRLLDRRVVGAIPPPGQILVTRAMLLAGAEPVTDIAARIAWDGGAEPLSIWARGRWRGEDAEVRLSDLRVDDYLGGQTMTPMRLAVRTPFGNLDSDGTITGGAAPTGEIDLRVTVASAGGLARWLGTGFPFAGLIDRYSFEGRGALTPRGFSSPSAVFSAGGGQFEGTLALRVDGERPQISGTLATKSIDFDALAAPIDKLQEAAGPWSADPFEPAPLRRTDVDVRVSAGHLRALGARLEDAALSIILSGGRLELVLGRALAYGGSLRGRTSIQGLDAARIEARLHATFDALDVGAAAQDVIGRRPLSGRGQGQVQIESAGASPAELMRQLQGKFTAQLRDGDIAGVSLTDAVRLPVRGISGAIELGRGRTSFSAFDFAATLNQGVAEVSEALLTNGAMRARAAGEISIRDQSLRLEGRAQAPGLPPAGLPFALRGPWLQLDMRWDPLGSFRRS